MQAPETLAQARGDLKQALAIMHERRPRYLEARNYYAGTAEEPMLSPTLRALIAKSGGKLRPPSFAHIPIDSLADRIELAGVSADGAVGDRLADILDGLDFEAEADEWELQACLFGDYYVVVDPMAVDERGAATEAAVVGRSPLTAVAVYSSRDPRVALFFAQVYSEGEGRTRQHYAILYYDDETLLLATGPGRGGSDGERVADYGPDLADQSEPDSWRLSNEAGSPLMVHYRVGGRPYGTPQHIKAWAAQDAITKISSVDLAATELQGFPSRYALLDPMAESDDDIDADFGDDGPGTQAGDRDGLTSATTGSSNLKDLPGTTKLLAGVKSVTQLAAVDSGPMLAKLEWWVRSMATSTGVPFFEFDAAGVQPSGESRRRASARLINRAKKAQRALGAAHVRLVETLLAAFGIDAASAGVRVAWLPAEVANDVEGMALVKAKTRAGVPLRDALVEAGYLPETVDGWLEIAPRSLDEVEAIAGTLAELGKAATLGVVSGEELRALLPDVLTGAVGEGLPAAVEPGLPLAPLEPQGPTDADAIALELARANVARAKFEAVGVGVRAGADALEAAALVGLDGVTFPNVPTTVRIPESEAGALEGSGPAAPSPAV